MISRLSEHQIQGQEEQEKPAPLPGDKKRQEHHEQQNDDQKNDPIHRSIALLPCHFSVLICRQHPSSWPGRSAS